MDEKSQQIINSIKVTNHQLYEQWINDTLFTWRWWFGIILTIIPWVLWIVLRKKQSTYRLLMAGFIAVIFSSLLDYFGATLTLWYYPHKIYPMISTYVPWDFSFIPVSIMFLLQYKRNLNVHFIALAFGAFTAFVAEPFFIWIKLYYPINWKSIYSFPIYIIIFYISYWLSNRNEYNVI